MAYDANIYDAFSGRPAYQLHLYVRINTMDVTNNRTSFAWALYAERTAAGTTWAGDPQAWSINVGGSTASGSHHMDFRSTSSILMGSGTTSYFNHNSTGYLNVAISASINASGELFGTAGASGTFVVNRNPRPPTAPSNISISELQATSFVYKFSGAGVDNGGSAVTGWDAQIATNSGFTTGVQTVTSSGTTTFTGLVPGTQYWVRARGKNAYWSGAWSTSLTATTTSGALVGKPGAVEAFVAAPIYVGYGGAFVLTELRVGAGGVFVLPSP